MKPFRKFVLGVSIAIAAIFNSCNPAIADLALKSADPGIAYTYRLEDGVIVFAATPCKHELILAFASPDVRPELKAGTVTPNEPTGPKAFDLCWLENDGVLIVITPQGNVFGFPLNDPRMTKRTSI